mmetsp:Transcript_2784/g.5029  ORF Transcript_2784/g.5029 Transcript_2784/m.5029 type:complete len:259 (+) Transcript_2784:74-850(+)
MNRKSHALVKLHRSSPPPRYLATLFSSCRSFARLAPHTSSHENLLPRLDPLARLGHVLPRPGVAIQDVLQFHVLHLQPVLPMFVHGPLDEARYVQESQPDVLPEHFVRRLVRRVQYGRHGTPDFTRVVREADARVLLVIGPGERERRQFGQVQRPVRHPETVRPRHGVHDGQAHVGPSQLGQARRVLRLDHGVDDRLGVDDDVDVVVGGAEEVVRLDDLQPLVHHGGAVQRNLGPHVPIRMRRRLGLDRPRIVLAHLE